MARDNQEVDARSILKELAIGCGCGALTYVHYKTMGPAAIKIGLSYAALGVYRGFFKYPDASLLGKTLNACAFEAGLLYGVLFAQFVDSPANPELISTGTASHPENESIANTTAPHGPTHIGFGANIM